MLHSHKTWTKKALKAYIAERAAVNLTTSAGSVLQETSFFGPEIRPNVTVVACLNHPKRKSYSVPPRKSSP